MRRFGKGKLIWAWLLILAFMANSTNASFANHHGEQVDRSLQGTITDEDGQPIEGASIQLGAYAPETGFHFIASATTNEEGFYSISYTKTLGDAVSAILTVRGYVTVFEVQSELLDFQIPEQKAAITGKITFIDEFETPVSDYPISLSVYLGRGGRINIAETKSDHEGNYALSVIPGIFQSARGPNAFELIYNNSYTEGSIELYSGDHKVMNKEVSDMSPSTPLNGRLEVEVTDESGIPIENAGAELAGTNTNIPLFQAGHYFFTDIIRGGTYTLKVAAPGYGPTEEIVEINGGIHRLTIKLNLDRIAPVTVATASEQPRNGNWYKSDVHVTLTSSDNLSGIEKTAYSLDNGSTWQEYKGVIALTNEGEHTLLYRSQDQAGNIEPEKQLHVKIDKTAPTLQLTLNRYTLSPANHKMIPIEAIVEGLDAGSGIEAIQLTSIHSSESNPLDIQNADYGTYDTAFELRAEISSKGSEREYTVVYTATDKAGNSTAATGVVTVSKHKKDK